MSFTRFALLAEARSWLGTPWHHQASLKGVGCDCIGFVRGVAEPFVGRVDCPMNYAETWPLYRAEEQLRNEMAGRCIEIDPEHALPGDILLFGAGKGPAHHCGYLTEGARLIHCYREAGRVVEQDMTPFWAEKIRGAFRLPGIADGRL
jgi:NlpC/P60 family putative phage cell wall peptidase